MPRVVDHGERRASFVSASWDVIAREGLGAASLRRVAAEAGQTTGALTHYFIDRDALLIEALRAAHAAAGARMRAALDSAPDPRGRLEAVVDEASPLDAVRLREWKVWLAFWGAAAGDDALAEENRRRYVEWRALLEALVGALMPDPDAARREADLLMALIDGLGVGVALQRGGDLAPAQAQARAQLSAAIDRLCTRDVAA